MQKLGHWACCRGGRFLLLLLPTSDSREGVEEFFSFDSLRVAGQTEKGFNSLLSAAVSIIYFSIFISFFFIGFNPRIVKLCTTLVAERLFFVSTILFMLLSNVRAMFETVCNFRTTIESSPVRKPHECRSYGPGNKWQQMVSRIFFISLQFAIDWISSIKLKFNAVDGDGKSYVWKLQILYWFFNGIYSIFICVPTLKKSTRLIQTFNLRKCIKIWSQSPSIVQLLQSSESF